MRPNLAALSIALCLPLSAQADAMDDRAMALFSAAFADNCLAAFLEDGTLIEPPQRFALTMGSSYGEPEPAVLWQFRCDMGAYNISSIFVLHTDIDGLRPLALPSPRLHIENEDPENFESPVKEVRISGWSADLRAGNATVDPAKATLSTVGYWRGIGDAYDAATYSLRDGGAALVHYEADAAYDGEIAPQLAVDFP